MAGERGQGRKGALQGTGVNNGKKEAKIVIFFEFLSKNTLIKDRIFSFFPRHDFFY